MQVVLPFVEGHWEARQRLEEALQMRAGALQRLEEALQMRVGVLQMREVQPFLVDHWEARQMLEVEKMLEGERQMLEGGHQILVQPFVVVH